MNDQQRHISLEEYNSCSKAELRQRFIQRQWEILNESVEPLKRDASDSTKSKHGTKFLSKYDAMQTLFSIFAPRFNLLQMFSEMVQRKASTIRSLEKGTKCINVKLERSMDEEFVDIANLIEQKQRKPSLKNEKIMKRLENKQVVVSTDKALFMKDSLIISDRQWTGLRVMGNDVINLPTLENVRKEKLAANTASVETYNITDVPHGVGTSFRSLIVRITQLAKAMNKLPKCNRFCCLFSTDGSSKKDLLSFSMTVLNTSIWGC